MVEMQILSPVQGQPLPAVQWNYLEVKGELEKSLAAYKSRAYTPDALPAAKADRAKLNKLCAAVGAKRREVKALYLQPYAQFEAQCKEIEGMIGQACGMVDAQIKAFESAEAEQKKAAIALLYEEYIGDMRELLPLSVLESPRWLNKTYRLDLIREELAKSVELYRQGVQSLREVCGQDADACIHEYLTNGGDMNKAIARHKELERLREESARRDARLRQERVDANAQRARRAAMGLAPEPAESLPPAAQNAPQRPSAAAPAMPQAATWTPGGGAEEDEPAPALLTLDFRVTASRSQLMALRAYMIDNKIQFGRVPAST